MVKWDKVFYGNICEKVLYTCYCAWISTLSRAAKRSNIVQFKFSTYINAKNLLKSIKNENKFVKNSYVAGHCPQTYVFSCKSQLYKSVCLSISWSVGQSVCSLVGLLRDFFTAENAKMMSDNKFLSPMEVVVSAPAPSHTYTCAQMRIHAQFATIGRAPALSNHMRTYFWIATA